MTPAAPSAPEGAWRGRASSYAAAGPRSTGGLWTRTWGAGEVWDRACRRLRSVSSPVNRVPEVIMIFRRYNSQILFTSLVVLSPPADTFLFVRTTFRGCPGSKVTSRCFRTVGRWALKAVKSPSSAVRLREPRVTVHPDSCTFHFSIWQRVDSARQTTARAASDFKSLCSGFSPSLGFSLILK